MNNSLHYSGGAEWYRVIFFNIHSRIILYSFNIKYDLEERTAEFGEDVIGFCNKVQEVQFITH